MGLSVDFSLWKRVRNKMLLAWDEVRETPSNLLRILAWLPILWRDRDWDSVYLYEIMLFKLIRIKDRINFEYRHVGCEDTVKDINICIEVLRRKINCKNNDMENLQREIYCTCEDRDRTNDKYFKENTVSGYVEWKPPPLCRNCRFHYKVMLDKREKEQWKLFCDILRRKSTSWWT